MTCAECNDLLLDLAYGELEGPRAVEVADHARGCARCGPALSELLRLRRAAAPLAEVEEPPARMDEAILEAARAQAFLLSGGTPGAVVETAAREQARAVEPLRVDARARVRRGEGGRGRRAWAVRAAIAGSVAAAAGLAVLVSSSGRKPAPRTDEADFRIQIHAPQDAAAQAPANAPAPPPAPSAAPSPAPAAAPPPAPSAAPRPSASTDAFAFAERAAKAGPPQGQAAAEGGPEPAREEASGAARAQAKVAAPEAPAPDAAQVEQRAASARRGGAYAAAGVLYRQAAGLRGARGDADGAGWDLAHAVECFAAAGDFGQARSAQRELRRTGSAAAQGAADRALRTAPPEPAAETAPAR